MLIKGVNAYHTKLECETEVIPMRNFPPLENKKNKEQKFVVLNNYCITGPEILWVKYLPCTEPSWVGSLALPMVAPNTTRSDS